VVNKLVYLYDVELLLHEAVVLSEIYVVVFAVSLQSLAFSTLCLLPSPQSSPSDADLGEYCLRGRMTFAATRHVPKTNSAFHPSRVSN